MSSQVSVQLHHLILFVLVVFSFNVVVLAYLTGAFSFGSVSQLTSSIISRIAERRPTAAIPPWQRILTDDGSSSSSEGSSSLRHVSVHRACDRGSWREESSRTEFCKTTAEKWVEFRGDKILGEYREIWSRSDIREVALFDSNQARAIVLKDSRAFLGKGLSAEDAIRVAFDTLYLKGGRFAQTSKPAGSADRENHNKLVSEASAAQRAGRATEQAASAAKAEGGDIENEDEDKEDEDRPKHDLKIRSVTNVDKDCTDYWSKGDEIAFCRLRNGEWVELDDSGTVKFEFKELYRLSEKGEVALFDESRLIVICLLRGYGLIGHPQSAAQALDVARETDDVLFKGGRWRSDAQARPIPPRVSPDVSDQGTVMVLISSYRDVLCSNTLKELFANAYNPDRVRVSVVNQANIGDIDCLDGYCKDVGESQCRRSQVSQIRLPMDKSRGVMFARFLQQTLIRDEEFCLQVDSHMVFPTNWDRIAIQDWLSADNEMAVMTTYPNRAIDRSDDRHSPVRCNTVWGTNVVACGTAAHNIVHKQKNPHLTAFFGAGIAFSKCHANLVVPYDPYMAFLFKGEEYNRSARLWTHGYDLYAPKRNYAYHFYDEDPRPEKYKNVARDRSFFGSSTDSTLLLKQSEYRWQAIMGMIPPQSPVSKSGDKDRLERLRQAHARSSALKQALLADVELFGLGNKRSLREYQVFSGINLAKHTNKDLCDQIGKMPWIPWNNTGHSVFGKDCPLDASRDCCKPTLDKAMERGGFLSKYIAFTNEEWASYVKKSDPLGGKNATSLLNGPILEVGWSTAEKTC